MKPDARHRTSTPVLRLGIAVLAALALTVPPTAAQAPPPAAIPNAVVVRHAPSLNGRVEGSVRLLNPESLALNGSAALTGDLLVPGTPRVVVNGHPTYSGALDGAGGAEPSTHTVTINGGASLRYLRRRSDPVALPAVPVPPASTGTRSVVLNVPGANAGDWSTVRDLTLNSNAGLVAVPPGTYRNFTANGGTGFVLGVAGATQAAVYNLDQITLNGGAPLQVVGPVVVNVGSRVQANGGSVLGAPAHPEWLALAIARFDLTLNGSAALHGNVQAPAGTVTVNGGTLAGSVAADRVALNGNGTIRFVAPPDPVPQDVTAPLLTVVSPADGFVSPAARVSVFGTVADASPFTVQVEGREASPEDEAFVADLDLGEGEHTLRVVATDAAGNRSETARTIVVDTQDPALSDLEPASGTVIPAREATVRGRVADRTAVEVQVGPVAATVSPDGTFAAAGVPLAEGENALAVTATDRAGHATTVTLLLLGQDLTPPAAPELFPLPLLTREPLLSVEGRAEPGSTVRIAAGGAPVTAPVAAGSGLFLATVALSPGANSLTVASLDGGGNASPARAATVLYDPQAPLAAAGLPSYLHIATGDGQRTLAGSELARPLIAVVKDRDGAPLAGVAVSFQVLAGEGHFVDGGSTAVVASDRDGYARVRFVAGAAGPQLVRAGFDGNLFAPVVFGADALEAVPGRGTSVTGVVRDVNLRALPNVLVRLGGQQTRTGAGGRFRFEAVPAGPHQLLELIGRDQVPYPGRWPNISYDLDVVAGLENHLGRPLFLPKVESGVALPLDGSGKVTEETSVQIAVAGGRPPVRVTARAGTRVTFPADATDKRLSVTRIPASRIPMALEDGRATNLYISVQPAGALFDPPLAVSFPNLDGQPAGAEVLLMSFDHDAGRYVQVGTARVSADGRTVESVPGSGIRVGAWHAAPPPLPGRQVTAFGQLDLYAAKSAPRRGQARTKEAEVIPPLAGKHIDDVLGTVYGSSATKLTPESAWHHTRLILLRASFTIPGNAPAPRVKYDVEVPASDPDFAIASVSFTGGYELLSNDGKTRFKKLQWTAPGGAGKAAPVAYKAGAAMKVAATFSLSKEVVCPPSGGVRWQASFDTALPTYAAAGANQKSTLHLSPSEMKCDAKGRPVAELPETPAAPAFAPGTINYANPLVLPWRVTAETGGEAKEAGSSKNPLYVTLAEPPQPFHTVVHVATAGLEGKQGSDPDGIFEAIWRKFQTLDVKRIEPAGEDGDTMLYWGEKSTPKPETPQEERDKPEFFQTFGLLKNADGRCGAWKRFLQDTVLAQGITGGRLNVIRPLDNPLYPANQGWLRGIMVGPLRWASEEGSCNWSTPGPPPPGQGGLVPPGREAFTNHALLVYKGKLYDPSYGNVFPDLSAWENYSLYAAFYRRKGTTPDTDVCRFVLNTMGGLETNINPDDGAP